MTIDTPIQEARPAVAGVVDPFLARIDRLGPPASPSGRRVTTRAPFRLDVMGGFADASGALTLSWPLADGLTIAARSREDQHIRVSSVLGDADGSAASSTWSLSAFYAPDGRVVPDLADERLPGSELWDRALAAVLYVMLRRGHLPHLGGGASLCVDWPVDRSCELEATVPLQVAAALALARLMDVPLDGDTTVAICVEAQRLAPGLAIGPAAPMSALAGQSEALLQVRGGSAPAATLRLPAGVAVMGVTSGAPRPLTVRKCVAAHVAAAMGLRIAQSLGPVLPSIVSAAGQLGRITVADYLEHLRDRLPTRIKGKAFVERFGALDDAWPPIDAEAVYKVRSRTEHHIYENARAHQFVERLSRAARTSERGALLEAGELMYASHWSFGQRCGLGGIETDRLVNALRERGPSEGIFGARTSGLGRGGAVAVLLADTAASRQVVSEVIAAYQAQTGLSAGVQCGSSHGALRFGTPEM